MSKDYIGWDEYFMGVALLSSKRSKDPNTKVGACIVNSEKRIVGIGYNGFPVGCDDKEFPWGRDGDFLDTKYPYVVHAEPNAILNSNSNTRGCTLYVSLFPCNECAKLIIQSGVKEIVFISNKYEESDSSVASRKMFEAAGVKYRQMPSPKIKLNYE